MGSAGILVHVADLAEALGSATRTAELAGVKVMRLARWAAESPWLLAELEVAPGEDVVAGVPDFDRAMLRGPFASVDNAIAASDVLRLRLVAFGASLVRPRDSQLERVWQAQQRQEK